MRVREELIVKLIERVPRLSGLTRDELDRLVDIVTDFVAKNKQSESLPSEEDEFTDDIPLLVVPKETRRIKATIVHRPDPYLFVPPEEDDD